MAEETMRSQNGNAEPETMGYLYTVQGRIVEHLFRDLSSLQQNEGEIAETLYYDRESEIRLLARNIERCRTIGRNILVTGGNAVGKTSLVTRCFSKGFISPGTVYPMVFDCRAEGDLDKGLDRTKSILVSLFAGYIRKLKERFPADKGLDAEAIYKNTKDPIEQFRRAVRMIGDRTAKQRLSLCPILFIDDIDFSENVLQEQLLSMLIPVIKNPNMVVIYAARPPAAATLRYHQDSRLKDGFSQAYHVHEDPLGVRGLIATRLAFLLAQEDKRPFFVRLAGTVIRRLSTLEEYLRQHGIGLEDLERIPYPLNSFSESFIQRISNGNIKETLGMATTLLAYIHQNKKKLQLNEDGSYELAEEDILAAMTADYSEYKLLNIHEKKSKRRSRSRLLQNNSAIQNVLELFVFTDTADEAFYERLCGRPKVTGQPACLGFGHTRAEVREAIEVCLNERLIEERVFRNYPPITLAAPERAHTRAEGPYEVTDKGFFYIMDLMYWSSYVARFGSGKRSVLEPNNEGDIGRFGFETDLLEFLTGILAVSKKGRQGLKVSKQALYDFFKQNYGDRYLRSFRTTLGDSPAGHSLLSIPMFNKVLTERGLCSFYKIGTRHYYSLKPNAIRSLAREAELPAGINRGVLSEEEVKEFCEKNVSWETSE